MSRPKLLLTFLTTSAGHVMISAPTSSAWITLYNSRQLAHNNLTPALLCVTVTINGNGSTPVSAILPANTETYVGTPSVTASVISLTCSIV